MSDDLTGMDSQQLLAWEESRVPATPRKQWGMGWLMIVFALLTILTYWFPESPPVPYPVAPIVFLLLSVVCYVAGTVLYKQDESRIAEENRRCQHCGRRMEARVVDMDKRHLGRAPLSRAGLLHRRIQKDKLFEGADGRLYMTGKKHVAPGPAGWEKRAFKIKAKWLACADCQSAYVEDAFFETVAETEARIADLLKGKASIG